MPLYEDWASCREVISDLDRQLSRHSRKADVLVVDDASSDPGNDFLAGLELHSIESVSILRLRRNLGHQRAIAVGLAYLDHTVKPDKIVVMDSDGEDAPRDVPMLLDAFDKRQQGEVVFAERTRRSEGFVFSLFYALYRFVHLLLTGISVRVGNFSVLSGRAAQSLVVVPELWNHYAAAVFISRVAYSTVPTSRAKRISGESKMGFVRLVMHGLSAISVFSDVVSVRVLLASGMMLAALIVGTIAAFLSVGGPAVLPDWAVSLSAVMLLAVLQGIAFILLFTFTVLANRKGAVVLLARDYSYFVGGVEQVSGPRSR